MNGSIRRGVLWAGAVVAGLGAWSLAAADDPGAAPSTPPAPPVAPDAKPGSGPKGAPASEPKAPAPASSTPAPGSQAQPASTTPASTKPASTKPTDGAPVANPKAAPRGAAKAPEFPAPVEKELFADNDLRGKPAPKFVVEKWFGPEPDRKGKLLLIDFWATWCPPCRALIPELETIQEKFKDDLVVVGVSGERDEGVVSRFIAQRGGVKYAMAWDPKNRMDRAVGVGGLPHVIVVDTAGVVRWQGFPLADADRLTEDVLRRIIEADKAARATREAAKP